MKSTPHRDSSPSKLDPHKHQPHFCSSETLTVLRNHRRPAFSLLVLELQSSSSSSKFRSIVRRVLAKQIDAKTCSFKLSKAFPCFAIVAGVLVLYGLAKIELGPGGLQETTSFKFCQAENQEFVSFLALDSARARRDGLKIRHFIIVPWSPSSIESEPLQVHQFSSPTSRQHSIRDFRTKASISYAAKQISAPVSVLHVEDGSIF